MQTPRLVFPLALAVCLLGGGSLFVASSPAEAQCLAQDECDALKAQLKDFRSQAKAQRQELRNLRDQIRALPRGSSERRTLKQQARALRRTFKQQRREVRPVLESFRQGCKNC